ncbi:chymotrypsin-like elastase family member 2A [Nephila pilipes]|uniref:Chymotrypsin-like elastase family member 2A n=1 Tax=Nephila pilipes TaxID=299642 RepID=A0A8X6T969_NEPPI|nr:chymotrypsin-like elastase family member 2A [Nephila pilipes]
MNVTSPLYCIVIFFFLQYSIAHGVQNVSHGSQNDVVPDYKIVLDLEHPREYISSPGFPNDDYPPDIQIIYDIEINIPDEIKQKSTRILLTFEMFVIEESPFCTNDGLEIADSSGQVRVYCGAQVGRAVLSESSKLQIRFFTNSVISSRGYSILVEMYNTQCSQMFKGVNTGTFSSPNFPGRYYANDLCVWKIEAPEGKVIRVKFDETFDIRAHEPLCVQDHLEVSLTGDFSTHVKRYCHGTRPVSMVSSGNSMLFVFRTDCCFEGKGFKASFAVIDSDDVVPTPPPEPKPHICSCGEENIQEVERIMGGKTVDPPNRYPWVVALVKKKNNVDDYFCGGALISRLYVITASHCLERENASKIRVALGAHDSDDGPDPVAVSKIILHPKYYKRTYLNDIALVKLQEPATLSEKVRVICLPTYPAFTSPNDTAVVAGWGWNRFQQKYEHWKRAFNNSRTHKACSAICGIWIVQVLDDQVLGRRESEMETLTSESAAGTSSAREAGRRLGLPPSLIRNILHGVLNQYPYK